MGINAAYFSLYDTRDKLRRTDEQYDRQTDRQTVRQTNRQRERRTSRFLNTISSVQPISEFVGKVDIINPDKSPRYRKHD